jgi:nicotinamidase-related amidase
MIVSLLTIFTSSRRSSMQALLVVDAQNEFSPEGSRAVPGHAEALAAIQAHAAEARQQQRPIAWVRHHNRPHESPAFRPGSWGAEFSPGLGVELRGGLEREFLKDVYGAFTTTGLEGWLRGLKVNEVLIVGFFAHMCVSTSVREALVRDFAVVVDPAGTGARALEHPLLGRQTAEEVKRTALLQMADMGAVILGAAVAR